MRPGFLELGVVGAATAVHDNTASAVDMAQICIDQIDAGEPELLAWQYFDAEILLKHAQSFDRDRSARARNGTASPDGPLVGLPFGVKDIFNTMDFPTQMGSPLWHSFTPGNDARSVFHASRAGGIVAGKTVTAEFAVHALGATLNPYDVSRTPGTSSSGSAAAVAAGMVPFALGTQTAGSIIRPASFCGVYGFKPSFGLIPRTGMLKTTDSLDTIGYFVPHAADLSPVLEALRVHGADYPIVDAAFGDSEGGLAKHNGPWRVAVVKGPTWDDADLCAKQALDDWAGKLFSASGFEQVEGRLPQDIEDVHSLHSDIYDASLAYYFKGEGEKTEFVSPIMNEIIAHGRTISPGAYRAALERQELMCRQIDACFERYDFIVTLSTAGAAPLRAESERRDSALIWTFLHLPALSAPAFADKNGLPFGLQIVGRRYSDLRLIEFVNSLTATGLLPEKCELPPRMANISAA